MRRQLAILGAVALAACAPPAPPPHAEDAAIVADATAETREARAENLSAAADSASRRGSTGGWRYDEKMDEMRSAMRRTAALSATRQIDIPFPYGRSTPSLHLRQDPKFGFDIYLAANGQFLCRPYGDDTINVKFDDGPIETWGCAEADGGSSDVLFISREQAFLAKLRHARRVIIEAYMYEAGRQQMTFKVAGLAWR